MVDIDWAEFKVYKQGHLQVSDNFLILLSFLQNYYNMVGVREIYETLTADDLAIMMLEKKGIASIVDLEGFLYNLRRR